MEFKLKNVLGEVSVAATFGIGYFLLKNRTSKVKDKYLDFEHISQSQLIGILDEFEKLESIYFQTLLQNIEQFLELETNIREKKIEGGQFQLNRLCGEIQNLAKKMCYEARSSANPEVITASIDVEREDMPNLLSSCENMLKNAILDTF